MVVARCTQSPHSSGYRLPGLPLGWPAALHPNGVLWTLPLRLPTWGF